MNYKKEAFSPKLVRPRIDPGPLATSRSEGVSGNIHGK